VLSLRTTDAWTAGVIIISVGGGPETYTIANTSAFEVMQGLVGWANSGARAWYGTRTFSWTWARNATDGGALLTLTATGGYSLTPGATGTALLGFSNHFGFSSVTADTSAAGTFSPLQARGRLSVNLYYRSLNDPGDAAGAGAIRPGVPGWAAYKPKVEAIGNAIDAARIGQVLRYAASPRYGTVWQQHRSSWLPLSIGPVSRTDVAKNLYRFSFDCGGEVV
jgi:hypothetical protein